MNDTQIEDVIDLLVNRSQGFKKGRYSCYENTRHITKLEGARIWLNERTCKHQEQGV
ncbi:hypothetical protein P4324_04855 [Bacillus thuringiensis]|nr:hypothetical protein [Bacillus thuringiensis]